MTNSLEALIKAAKKYRLTHTAHCNYPMDSGALYAWDKATNEIDALINNDEINIIVGLIVDLEQLQQQNIELSNEKCALEAVALAMRDDMREALQRNAEMEAAAVKPGSVMYKGAEIISKEGLELIRDGVAEATDLEISCMASALLAATQSEVKPVKLPMGYIVRAGHPSYGDEKYAMIPKEGGNWLSRFDVEHTLRASGITVEGS
jgi:hypothetical protein